MCLNCCGFGVAGRVDVVSVWPATVVSVWPATNAVSVWPAAERKNMAFGRLCWCAPGAAPVDSEELRSSVAELLTLVSRGGDDDTWRLYSLESSWVSELRPSSEDETGPDLAASDGMPWCGWCCCSRCRAAMWQECQSLPGRRPRDLQVEVGRDLVAPGPWPLGGRPRPLGC